METTLSDRDFSRLSQLIKANWGIKMPPAKKGMLQGRLAKRLRALGFEDLDQYCDYLFSPEGMDRELGHVIDVVSTNKTEFFREPESFTYLLHQALPSLIRDEKGRMKQSLRLWSAGCSSGEEPYTLAMFVNEFLEKYTDAALDYSIMATDISSSALERAVRAVYPHAGADAIPMKFRKKYLWRSKDKNRNLVRIRPELRAKVKFRSLNLVGNIELQNTMDVIFCRNVIIYFDRPTQVRLFQRFSRQLNPGGYIFIGHSESLHGMDLPLVQVAPTIYRLRPGPSGYHESNREKVG